MLTKFLGWYDGLDWIDGSMFRFFVFIMPFVLWHFIARKATFGHYLVDFFLISSYAFLIFRCHFKKDMRSSLN